MITPRETITLHKMGFLHSTAVGYDISFTVAANDKRICKREYKNITLSTMKRFYNLSKGYIDCHYKKIITYDMFWSLDPDCRDKILFSRST